MFADDMVLQIFMIVLGLAVLLIAGDLLVRGAVGLATAFKIPALVVSLTIVAFGTSAPELFVSIQAVLAGESGIAIGNIIGSNVANVLLVLGLPAMIYPVSAHVVGLRRHGVIMLLATGVFAAFAYLTGVIGQTAGLVLIAGIVFYIVFMWVGAVRGAIDDPVIGDAAEYAESAGLSAKTVLFLVAGLAGLPFGANLLVSHGGALATDLGVRHELVGLTIVAFGTSLPELATVMAAALHRKSDVAIGGIVGSNIFNIFAVGGAAGLAGTSYFTPTALYLDIPVMIAAALLICFAIFTKRDIGRLSGAAMMLAYIGFIVAVAVTAGA